MTSSPPSGGNIRTPGQNPVCVQTGCLGERESRHVWEQFWEFGIVHAFFQPASNHVFYDFSATDFEGSKGIAQPPHRYCRSQALEEGVGDCILVGRGALLHAIPKGNQRRGSSPPWELASTFRTHDTGVWVMCFVVIVSGHQEITLVYLILNDI